MTETQNVPKLRFNEFTEGGYETTLGKVCKINKGKQLNKENMVENGKYYVLNGGKVPSGYTNSWNTEKNTITISEGGNSCGFVNFNKENFWAGGHCYNLTKLSSDININYLFNYLKFKELKIMKLRVGSGLPNIQKGDIENFKIYLMPIEEQRKIGKFLSLFNNEIKLLNKKLSLYQSLKNDLPNKIFNKSLEFKDKNGSTEYKWGELELKNVLIEFNKKVGLKFNYPILSSTLSGIYFQEDYFNGNVNSQNLEEYKLVPRGYFTYRSMSDTGVFKFNIQNITDMGIISPAYPVFNVKNINKYYLYDYLNYSADIKKQILKIKEGGTRYALSFSKFKKLTVKTPPIEIQNKISNIIYYYNLKHTKIENEKNLLLKYKKGLLQQMFI